MSNPRLYRATYTRSDVRCIEAIEKELATRGKLKVWLTTICSVPRKTTYAALAGTYPASPTTVIERIEISLGITPPQALVEFDSDPLPDISWKAEPDPHRALHEQIMATLAPHDAWSPLDRCDLIACFKGQQRRIVEAIDALIDERKIVVVRITRKGKSADYLCPSGKIIDARKRLTPARNVPRKSEARA